MLPYNDTFSKPRLDSHVTKVGPQNQQDIDAKKETYFVKRKIELSNKYSNKLNQFLKAKMFDGAHGEPSLWSRKMQYYQLYDEMSGVLPSFCDGRG